MMVGPLPNPTKLGFCVLGTAFLFVCLLALNCTHFSRLEEKPNKAEGICFFIEKL